MRSALAFCLAFSGAFSGLLLSQPVHAQGSVAPSASSGAPPQPGRLGLTLTQALERFRRQNLKLVAARYELSAVRADVIAAGLLPNPRLALTAGFHIHGESDSADQQYSVMLSQGLPLWGRLGASKAAATLTASATEKQFAADTWQLLSELRGAYLTLQLAEARQQVLTAGLADLQRVQGVLDARTAAGANPQYDRLRLEVERGTLRARIAEVELDVADARAALAASIGGAPQPEELAASDALPEPALDARETTVLVRFALEHRHEIAATRLETGAAEARLRAARKRFIPEPELGIGYARSMNIPGAPPGSSGGALLAAASIPLPVFDRGQGTIDRQMEQSAAARTRESDWQHTVQREVERAAHAVQMTTVAYRAYREEASHNAETVRRIAEVTYREGRGTILELLDAYSSYLRVEEQALELHGAALSASLELARALGPSL
ncbi:MAG: TolC family protein [Myxococcales bacterium]